jgi:hypothetical protein
MEKLFGVFVSEEIRGLQNFSEEKPAIQLKTFSNSLTSSNRNRDVLLI